MASDGRRPECHDEHPPIIEHPEDAELAARYMRLVDGDPRGTISGVVARLW
jgi:hypothetical protein